MKGQSLNRRRFSMGFRSLCALLLLCLTVFMAGCKQNTDENQKLLMLLGLSTGWYTFLGGSGHESGVSIRQTADGGYIAAGNSIGDIDELQGKTPLNDYTALNDMMVIKLERNGSVSWYTYLGGTGNDSASAIHQTADGGYIVLGDSDAAIESMGGRSPLIAYDPANPPDFTDMLAVKLNSAGAVSWYTFLGGSGSETGISIQQTDDAGYILAGKVSGDIPGLQGKTPLNDYTALNDMIVIKLHAERSVAWYTFLGGTGNDYATDIQQTADGGYIVVGASSAAIASMDGRTPLIAYDPANPAAYTDMLAVKLDSAGDVSWYTFLGGDRNDYARSVHQTGDNGYIIAGNSQSDITDLIGKTPLNPFQFMTDMLVLKLNSSGAVDWYTFLGGEGHDYAYSVRQTGDGGYIVGGYAGDDVPELQGQDPINPYSAGIDAMVAKLDATGTVAWYTMLGDSGDDRGTSIRQTRDGGFILCGNSDSDITEMQNKAPLNPHASVSDMMIVKLKSNGRL